MLTQFAPSRPPSSLAYCAVVVDDDPLVRKLVCRALARQGFDVFEASHGRAALDLIRASEFDLVVSDVQMPVMGGLELLQCLRVERPELPVVLLSGHFRLAAGQKPADLGAFALLGKPFSIEEVQATALRAVEARAQVDIPIANQVRS